MLGILAGGNHGCDMFSVLMGSGTLPMYVKELIKKKTVIINGVTDITVVTSHEFEELTSDSRVIIIGPPPVEILDMCVLSDNPEHVLIRDYKSMLLYLKNRNISLNDCVVLGSALYTFPEKSPLIHQCNSIVLFGADTNIPLGGAEPIPEWVCKMIMEDFNLYRRADLTGTIMPDSDSELRGVSTPILLHYTVHTGTRKGESTL